CIAEQEQADCPERPERQQDDPKGTEGPAGPDVEGVVDGMSMLLAVLGHEPVELRPGTGGGRGSVHRGNPFRKGSAARTGQESPADQGSGLAATFAGCPWWTLGSVYWSRPLWAIWPQ